MVYVRCLQIFSYTSTNPLAIHSESDSNDDDHDGSDQTEIKQREKKRKPSLEMTELEAEVDPIVKLLKVFIAVFVLLYPP